MPSNKDKFNEEGDAIIERDLHQIMPRAERRAHKYGHFSPNREFYAPCDQPQGIELELLNAWYEVVDQLWPDQRAIDSFEDRFEFAH